MNNRLILVYITGILIGISYGLQGPLLPVFAKNVTSNSFFISTTRAGTAVTFLTLGEGNAHVLSMA